MIDTHTRWTVNTVLVALVMTLAYTSPTLASFTVTEQSDQRLVATWRSAPPTIDTLSVNGSPYLRFHFDDAMLAGVPGDPGVPEVVTLIAVPPGMKAAIVVRPGLLTSRSGRLAPLPEETPHADGMSMVSRWFTSPGGYRRGVPERTAEIQDAGVVRGVHLARIVVRPLSFDPARSSISWAREFTINVTFTGTMEPVAPGAGVPLAFARSVLNARQAKNWGPVPSAGKVAEVEPSPFASGTWMRVAVSKNGIHKLTASAAAKADSRFADAPISKIAMFGGSQRELPRSATDSRSSQTSLTLVRPLVVDANSDGSFNDPDYLLFYAKGPTHWWQAPPSLTTTISEMLYSVNRYSNESIYWLAVVDSTAVQATVVSGDPAGQVLPEVTRYRQLVHEENEVRNFDEVAGDGPYSGMEWEWEIIVRGGSRTFVPTLHNMAGDTVEFRLGQLLTAGSPSIDVEIDGKPATYLATGMLRAPYSQHKIYNTIVPAIEERTLQVELLNDVGASREHLDFYEILYWRRFVVRNNNLDFFLPPHRLIAPDREVIVPIEGADASKHRLFEVTDGSGLREITLPTASGGVTRVKLTQSSWVARRYVLTTEDWLSPLRVEPTTYEPDLHGYRSGVDYVIIAHPDFMLEAERLAAWRTEHDTMRTRAVSVQRVYDEFALGAFDPSAIRDFVAFTVDNWKDNPTDPGLQYVVLMGDGQYDFRNLTRFSADPSQPHPGNWIPPYETGDVCTDDWYGVIGPGTIPSVQLGRLSVRTLTEARSVVDKLVAYDRRLQRGAWQTRAVLVADDEFNPEIGISTESYALDSESLLGSISSKIAIDKIYSFEYTMDAQGRKPTVRTDLVDAWASGAVFFNYIGHGNPLLWAHERIFLLDEDLAKLTNGSRLPVLLALTCSAAHFDDPKTQSMGEVLVNYRSGGAIATLGATRLVYNRSNLLFSRSVLAGMFENAAQPPRIGSVFWAAKAILLSIPNTDPGASLQKTNTRKYVLIGDPASRMALPELPVSVHVSGDSLRALSSVIITGAVRVPDGVDTLRTFNGTALVQIFDSATPAVHTIPSGDKQYYELSGATIYRGITEVVSGLFSLEARIPLEVVYGGSDARALAQVWNDQIDGAGGVVKLGIASTASTTSGVDSIGPVIQFTTANGYEMGEPLVDGMNIARGDSIRVWASDPSGINLTREIGHRMLVKFRDGTERDVTSDFVHWSSANRGWVDIPVTVSSGSVELFVEVWDNWNNFGADSLLLRVAAAGDIRVTDMIAVPNPMNVSTAFTWRVSGLGTEGGDVTVKIYTVNGRLVDTIRREGIIDGPVVVPWTPRRQLANGVHLYQVSIRRRSDGRAKRVIERLAVLGP